MGTMEANDDVEIEKDLLEAYRLDKKGLLDLGEKAEFRAGQILYYEDHTPAGVYLLARGKALVRRYAPTAEGRQREEVKAAPSFLGLKNFISQEPYAASLLLTEDSLVYFFSRGAKADALLRQSLVAHVPSQGGKKKVPGR